MQSQLKEFCPMMSWQEPPCLQAPEVQFIDLTLVFFRLTAPRERHLALQKQLGHQLHSTGPPHKRWLQHFSKDCLSNPLLHEGWLPWARSVKYSGHNDLKVLTVPKAGLKSREINFPVVIMFQTECPFLAAFA